MQSEWVQGAKTDITLPDVGIWADLKRPLALRNARDNAVEPARLVWSAYQAKLRRDQK